MLARIAALTLALSLVALVLPGPASPVGEASATCVEDPTGECLPVCEAAAVYEEVRQSTYVTEKLLPKLYCLM